MVPASDDAFASGLARELADDVRDRFVRYARIDTQAAPGHDEVPSTEKQLELSRLLVEELNDMGAADVAIDDHGIVFATIPATVEHDAPVFGVIAHVDTSFDAPGAGVRPQVVTYEGGTLALPGAPGVALDPAESPELAKHAGHQIVTSDGTTLLGADDKAGVAAIMTAARHLLGNGDLPHGKIRIAFTTDEEVGHGAKYFDIERFGASCAYTIDGSTAGDIEAETFSAQGVTVTFHGFSVHPGFAKDRLVSSLKLASEFVRRLPPGDAPETTDGREGFSHPVAISGGAEETVVGLIVRDFEMDEVDRRVTELRALAQEVVAGVENARVEVTSEVQYRNMRDHLADVPEVVDAAVEAVRRAGLEPRRGFIRGGTDGSVLTAKGLPTPNIFSGAQDFHSVKEWVCVHDMAAAAATIVHLAQVWAERA
jgi:tripeptide aminopeptidase